MIRENEAKKLKELIREYGILSKLYSIYTNKQHLEDRESIIQRCVDKRIELYEYIKELTIK